MDKIQNGTTPNEVVALTEVLLKRLNTSKVNACNRIKGCWIGQGRVEHIAQANHYRLFFLLEGKILLKNPVAGKHLLYGMEMMMLPAGSEMSCSALDKSKFVILDCTVLREKRNISYMEELKELALVYQTGKGIYEPAKTIFPICTKLERILNGFFAYTTDESRYPDVYDAVFIFLRSLYTPKELACLFTPMLHCKDRQNQNSF